MSEPSPPDAKQPVGTDWSTIYRRLEASRIGLEHGVMPTREERQKILRARAQTLAREPEREEATQGGLEVVEFLLAYETYGVESSYIREVYPLKELTPLPCTPPFVLGIIDVRGQILSVLDLKKFFDLPEKGLTDLNKVIVVHDATMVFGILSDAILGVRSIPLDSIQPSLPTLTGIRATYLKGVTGDRLVILDAGALLADRRRQAIGAGVDRGDAPHPRAHGIDCREHCAALRAGADDRGDHRHSQRSCRAVQFAGGQCCDRGGEGGGTGQGVRGSGAGGEEPGSAIEAGPNSSACDPGRQPEGDQRGSDGHRARQQGGGGGSAALQGGGESIRALAGNIEAAARTATQIAASAQQQPVGMDQVALAMQNIEQASAQNVTSAKQTESAAQNLHDLGQKLKQVAAQYRV
jgi:purine-binding chemotaxis protein CheW